MRIDLTIRRPDGTEHDVAITAPEGTTFAQVAPALIDVVPGAMPAWSGRRRLRPDSPLGRAPLTAGAVLTDAPRADDATGPGQRLEVVGGPHAGTGIALRRGELDIGRASTCAMVLADPRVSRRHAVITITGTASNVRDLGSTHGTSLDGELIAGERTLPPGAVIRVGDSFLTLREPDEPSASARPGPGGAVLVGGPPRPRPTLDDRIVEIPSLPRRAPSPRLQWAAALLPAAASAALAWAMHSMLILAFAALTPVAVLASAGSDRWRWRRDRRKAATVSRHLRAAIDHEITVALTREVRRRHDADPDPSIVLRIATTPGARLWQRRGDDADLLQVRIGLTDLPSALRVNRDGAILAAGRLTAVPRTVDLRHGPIGVAAPAPVRDGLARWLLGQLAVLVSPADLELAVLLSDGSRWTWLRWLPHLRGRIARTAAEQAALVDELAELSRSRRDGQARDAAWSGPWLVIVVDRAAVAAGSARLNAVLTDAASIGVTALCLADHLQQLPAACTQLVSALDESGSTLAHGGAEVVADRVSAGWADQVARALAPLRDAEADPSATLPERCRLAELLGTDPPTAAAIRARWPDSEPSARTVLGIGADGPVIVDLDRDGPHILVAGTTGSGKSELLQSLIVGLAVERSPADVTFLLVDYKGGAAFAECAQLPHTVGLVTDLDDFLTRRVLASLDSEIRHRERLLASAGVADRAAYRATGRSLPRLLVVVDEFATLAEELPAFVPGLVGIAQRGRSLGLHLVLATQRPAGAVSAEIRANTTLRIALRTTSAGESLDVIDRPDAVSIDRRTPGRGFLRTGSVGVAFQTAQVTGPAVDLEEVTVGLLDDWRQPVTPPSTARDTDLQRFVAAISAAAHDRAPLRRPWLPPLPPRIDAADLPEPQPPTATEIPIGLVDRPAEQRQQPLTVNLAQPESMLIVGGVRSGRTAAVLTLALAAAARRAPSDLHLHAIDGAGSALATLAHLPHVGTLATVSGGFDIVTRLIHRLAQELAGRCEALSTADSVPALLLVVDGWEAVVAGSEEHDGGRSIERFLDLVRAAPSAGATIVITGGRAALTPRLASLIATRFVLPMPDPADYAHAGVHRNAVPSVAVPGRAVRVTDGAEVQFAFTGDRAAQQQAVAACAARWPSAPPPRLRIRRLPSRVSLADPALRTATPAGWYRLGIGGDRAEPVVVDLASGSRRLLIAGPARSGRSTVLCALLQQLGARNAVIAAPPRSLLARAARAAGRPVLQPGDDPGCGLPEGAILLVDDCEAFADTPVGDALTEWVSADRFDRVAVVAARGDALAVTFRGLGAEARQAGCGVLLQPGPIDGELLGVSLPRTRSAPIPGRGVLVPDPAWQLGDEPMPIQLAEP